MFEDQGDTVLFYVVGQPGLSWALADDDASPAIMVSLCRTSLGADLKIKECFMERAAPGNLAPYQTFFRAPIHFNSEFLGIRLARGLVDQHLSTGSAELAHASEQIIVRTLAVLDRDNIKSRVQAKLIDLLPSGPVNQDTMARALNLNGRTLQRRLEMEGTNFRQISRHGTTHPGNRLCSEYALRSG